MQFLLTNDDGFDAPGLAALVKALSPLGHCVVLAPRDHHSGCGHQATTHRPLALETVAPDRHRLDGTPVDCTRVALAELVPRADWVISGINEGGNLGADVYHSGTVAAVREAALLGLPGIAISQYVQRRAALDWNRAARWTAEVVATLLREPTHAGGFWNVNLPDPDTGGEPALAALPKLVHCVLDPHPLPVAFEREADRFHYRGRYQDRARSEGCDVACCFAGHITLSQLRLGS